MKTLTMPVKAKTIQARISGRDQQTQFTHSRIIDPPVLRTVSRSGDKKISDSDYGFLPPAQTKLFYRIQEAADLTGLKPSVLRYWETEFRELRPDKDASDQRRYRQADIEVIRAIRKLLYEERYTIKGARGRLREELKQMRQAKQDNAEQAKAAQKAAQIVSLKPEAQAATPAPPTEKPVPVRAVPVKSIASKAAPAERQPELPSLTEFRTQPTQREEQRKRRLDQSLRNLRSEVSELLGMLS